MIGSIDLQMVAEYVHFYNTAREGDQICYQKQGRNENCYKFLRKQDIADSGPPTPNGKITKKGFKKEGIF